MVEMKWYMDREYIRGHLIGYTEFQLRQGYEINDVKEALLKYGYDNDLVLEVINSVDTELYKESSKKPSLKELNEDLYVYLQNLLVDYIKKELNHGYELDVIKKALINYGHHPSMVKKAIKAIEDGKVTDYHPSIGFPSWFMLIVSLVVIFAFLGFLLITTDASLYVVFLSFAPSIFTILFVYVMTIYTSSKKAL